MVAEVAQGGVSADMFRNFFNMNWFYRVFVMLRHLRQPVIGRHEAVRGIITDETSIHIEQIGIALQDALLPTNGILRSIEANTRKGRFDHV